MRPPGYAGSDAGIPEPVAEALLRHRSAALAREECEIPRRTCGDRIGYPFDDDALNLIEGWLRELEGQGSIRRYLVEGKPYLDIPKWLTHQKIDRPSKSKLPEFVDASRGLANSREGSMLDSRSLTLDPGPRTREQNLAAETVNEGTSPAYVGAREGRFPADDDLSDLEPAAWDDPRQFGRDRAVGGAR